jgi:Fe-S-cluster containining protein
MTQATETEWTTGKVTLSFFGEPIEMEMTVPARPVKPSRMLPIFQAVASSFVELGVSAAEAEGNKISCKAGCGACCRQPVPLAEIEVYQLAELVENMPEPRRTEIKQRFAAGVRHFHENGWFEKMEHYPAMSAKDRQALVMEYFYEGVACPFLENESCSIHPDRPLSCREYLVTSPAEHCARPTAETIRQVRFTVKPSIAALETSMTENLGGAFFVPMIRALEWAETRPDISEEKTGEAWMAEFFRHLTKGEIPAGDADTKDR